MIRLFFYNDKSTEYRKPATRNHGTSYTYVLHTRWVVFGAVATGCSALLAPLFIGQAKLVPLVPMLTGITALSVILLSDKGNEENREWALTSWGFAKQILPLLAVIAMVYRLSGYFWLVTFSYAYKVANLNMKNFTSATPLN